MKVSMPVAVVIVIVAVLIAVIVGVKSFGKKSTTDAAEKMSATAKEKLRTGAVGGPPPGQGPAQQSAPAKGP